MCKGGERGLVEGRWICNPEVQGSNSSPCHWMDLSSVAPNSTPPRLVNSQLVSLPPVGILNLQLCLICITFVCYAHLNIFTWNLRDINVYYIYIYYIKTDCFPFRFLHRYFREYTFIVREYGIEVYLKPIL